MENETKREMPFDCDAGMGYDFGVHPHETTIRKHEKYLQEYLTTEGRSGFLLLASRMMTSSAKAKNKDDFMCICLAVLKILREEVERLEGVNAKLALKSPHQPQYVGGQLVGFSRGDTTGEYRGVCRPPYMPAQHWASYKLTGTCAKDLEVRYAREGFPEVLTPEEHKAVMAVLRGALQRLQSQDSGKVVTLSTTPEGNLLYTTEAA